MKRFVFSLFCLSLITAKANALEESYLNFGLSLQNIIRGRTLFTSCPPWGNIESRLGNNGLLGINLNGYTFWNGRNIGLFVTENILLGEVYNTADIKDNSYVWGDDIIIGPGFRRVIAPNLTILGGFGVNFYAQFYNTTFNGFGFSLLGGQVGIKLDLTNVWCLLFGVNAGFCYARYGYGDYNWTGFQYTVTPFIGFGFNHYFDKNKNKNDYFGNHSYLGKPDNAENP